MHAEAKAYIASVHEWVTCDLRSGSVAVDLGGRETNGHARDVFPPDLDWIVVDAVDGPGVTVVANASSWKPRVPVELVMCAEVFEHTPIWAGIVANAYQMLEPGGFFVTTMAGPGRAIHGVNHDDPDQPGWYENIQPRWLRIALEAAGFSQFAVSENKRSFDVYGWAQK